MTNSHAEQGAKDSAPHYEYSKDIVSAPQITELLQAKRQHLESILKEMGSVLVAYSGGVDSSLLAFMAHRILPRKNLAVTAESEIYPTKETNEAVRIARQMGVPHQTVRTYEIKNKKFSENSPLRCYHCKQELFAELFKIAEKEQLDHVIDGLNVDDQKDFRPGAKAARELGIRSPLQEAGFTKDDIRSLSHYYKLPNWNKPSHPCLSTRFPYGQTITQNLLERVENAEEFLKALGVKQLRLREHGDLVRLEVSPEDMPLLIDPEIAKRVTEGLQSMGYSYVALDLLGYRSGSMNEVLKKKAITS